MVMGADLSAGGTAASGAKWFSIHWLVNTVGSLTAQLFLGWLLMPEHFGVFAIASAVALFARGFQDAGARNILIAGGEDEFARDVGSVFRLALATNCAICAILAIVAFPAARIYQEPQVASVLLVLAASIPLGTPWAVSSARLELGLRFKEYALIYMLRAVITHAGMIVFALLGMGPLAFVLPIPIAAIVMSVLGWRLSGMSFVELHNRQGDYARHARSGIWLMIGTLAAGVGAQGDYLTAGLLTSTTVVGVYYFAYQVPAQALQLSGNALNMLFPMLTRLRTKPKQLSLLVGQAYEVMVTLAVVGYVGLALVFPDLVYILWRGRWSDAVLPGQILSLGMPFLFMLAIPRALLLHAKRFAIWSMLNLALGLGLAVSGVVGGLMDDPALLAVAAVIAFIVVFVLAFMVVVVPSVIKSRQFIILSIKPMGAASIALLIALYAGSVPGEVASWPEAVIAVSIKAIVYLCCSTILLRLLAPDGLRAVLLVLPTTGKRAMRALRL